MQLIIRLTNTVCFINNTSFQQADIHLYYKQPKYIFMSILTKVIISIKQGIKSRLDYLSLQLVSLFLGFYVATIVSTLPSQTGDWGIIAGAIIVTFTESLSKIIYSLNNSKIALIYIVNCIKIGIIYGLFVDAFKLGS